MKSAILLLIFSFQLTAASGVNGTVASVKECSSSAMVWVSLDKDNYKERLLLMHTEVPVGGTFQFYLKPGNYQIRASDEKGCEYIQRIRVGEQLQQLAIKLERK